MSLASSRALLFTVPLLWFAVLGSAAGAVYCKHRARELFIQLEALDTARDNLDIEWGQLQLEESAWSTQAFVESFARTKLHMTTPPPQDIRLAAP
ncbi:MAG: cell division protein FtsL [Steroidobacteraceae bacterium]